MPTYSSCCNGLAAQFQLLVRWHSQLRVLCYETLVWDAVNEESNRHGHNADMDDRGEDCTFLPAILSFEIVLIWIPINRAHSVIIRRQRTSTALSIFPSYHVSCLRKVSAGPWNV